jgi:rsbT antagonist protein RsbS
MQVPILRLKDVLLTSIQVDLTDQEAMQFQSDMLHMVAKSNATGIVIDITAMEIVDSYMARVLNETATMVKVLGAEAVVCGMRPAVALTLIEMGRELVGVESTLNLDQAMDRIQQLIYSRTGDAISSDVAREADGDYAGSNDSLADVAGDRVVDREVAHEYA